jgi:hypothetical protein
MNQLRSPPYACPSCPRALPAPQRLVRQTCLRIYGIRVQGVGFGVWSLGCRVRGMGVGVWGLGFGVWVWVLGFGLGGLGFGVWGLRFGV